MKTKILVVDTTFLIDIQRLIQTEGRDQVRELLKEIIKQLKSVETIWIPQTVEKEFVIKDKVKRYKELLYLDLEKYLKRLGISIKKCPIYSKSELEMVKKRFPNLDAGETDAIHQAISLSLYKKYKKFEAVLISNDERAIKAAAAFDIKVFRL